MEPTEALRRLALFCGMGVNATGYYPMPGSVPRLPACVVFMRGFQTTMRGGEQEMILRADINLYLADVNQAEKVAGAGDLLAIAVMDRFTPSRDNPAYTLTLPGEQGSVKHCHVARGGDDPLTAQTSQTLSGWGATFYGAVLPVEIKLTRVPELPA
jgi:hypothetical protein